MCANVLLSVRHINLFLHTQKSASLDIINVSPGTIIYRLLTTSPSRYRVSGKSGLIPPSSVAQVKFTIISSNILSELGKKENTNPSQEPHHSSKENSLPTTTDQLSDPITDSFLLEYTLIDEAKAKELKNFKTHSEYILAMKKEGKLERRLIPCRVFVQGGGVEVDQPDDSTSQNNTSEAKKARFHRINKNSIKNAKSSPSVLVSSANGGRGSVMMYFKIIGMLVIMILAVQFSMWLGS